MFLILNFEASNLKLCIQANEIILRNFPKICQIYFTPPLVLGGGGVKNNSIGLIFLILIFKARDLKFCKQVNEIILGKFPKIS